MPSPEIKPVFYWPGSKGRLASWVNEILMPATTYIEPFAGSAAVLLAREPSQLEIINDLNRDVVVFFRALRDQPEELERRIMMTPYHEAEFAECLDSDPDAALDDIERARRFFVRTNQGFTGSAAWPGFAMTWSPGETTRAHKWAYLTRRLHTVAMRLRDVQITSRDALDVLRRYADDPDVAVYCDPPYHNDDVKLRYEHHSEHLHEDLAEVLHAMKGQVVVSGYPGTYDRLFPEWKRIERRVASTGGGVAGDPDARGGAGLERVEVLWSNRQFWPGKHLDEY